jgi:circadian clock protein KaiC
MPERDALRTGIDGLDAILLEGIPRGNVILVTGAPGTGKTILGLEFIYRGAHDFGEPGVVVTFEVSAEKLVRDAAPFGWDLRALEAQGRLKIISTSRRVFQDEVVQADRMMVL